MNDYERKEFIKQNEAYPPAWAIGSPKTWVSPVATQTGSSNKPMAGSVRADEVVRAEPPSRERAPDKMVEAVEVAAMNETFYMIPGCTEELFNKRLGWVYDIAGESISNIQFSHAVVDGNGVQTYSALVRFSHSY